MDRKEFLHRCGFACLGLMGVASLTESCGTTKAVSGQITGKRMSIPLAEFAVVKGEATRYKPYIVVRNAALNYPIVVYRQSESAYTALLLRCTHQNAVLNVAGELLTCPAHGSEFNMRGEVVQGPASTRLKQFPTSTDAKNLYIELA